MCLRKCCFCIPLRVGGLILGYILTLVKIILFIGAVVRVQAIKMAMVQQHIRDASLSFMVFMLYGVAFLIALEMIMAISLVVNLHKKQRVQVEKFYRVYSVLFVLYFLIFLVEFIKNVKEYSSTVLLFHLIDVAIWALELYTVFIAYRWVVQIEEQATEQEDDCSSRSLNPNNSVGPPPTYYDA